MGEDDEGVRMRSLVGGLMGGFDVVGGRIFTGSGVVLTPRSKSSSSVAPPTRYKQKQHSHGRTRYHGTWYCVFIFHYELSITYCTLKTSSPVASNAEKENSSHVGYLQCMQSNKRLLNILPPYSVSNITNLV
jgi:hypothetical protein